MSAHRVLKDLYRAFEGVGPGILPDPGNAGSIEFDMWGQYCPIVTATAETRTLAAPSQEGILATIVLKTWVGNLTLTVTGGYNQNGDTSIVFNSAGDAVLLQSIQVGSTYRWEAVYQTGTSASSALTESVTTTNVIEAAENGTRFVLNHATGFVSTLPAPAAGLEFWFYTGATPPSSGNHTIVTNSSANIIEGSIGTAETPTTAVSVVAAADTISFVASTTVTGDFAHVWSDGTNWFLNGMCFVQDGMTTTQATA